MSQDDNNDNKKEGSYLQKIANFFIIAESLVKIVYNVSQLYFAYQSHKNDRELGDDVNRGNGGNERNERNGGNEGNGGNEENGGNGRERNNNQSPSYPLNPPNDTELTENDVENRDACKVCLTNKIRTVNLPCGHLVFCFSCTRNFITNNFQHNCPICRVKITEIKMIYNV